VTDRNNSVTSKKSPSYKMAPIFNSVEKASRHLLQEQPSWRQEFEKCGALAKLKVTLSDTLDNVAGYTSCALQGLLQLEAKQTAFTKGLDETEARALEAKASAENASKDAAKVGKQAKEIASRCNRRQTDVQELALRMSEHVLICRGVIPTTRKDKESSFEMKHAFQSMVTSIGGPNLRTVSVKRLQRGRNANPDSPRPMRVELAGQEEKAILFQTMERALSQNKPVPFSVMHEIPRYAINAYKYCNNVAAVIRGSEEGMRTRVQIPRGRQWPAIFMKRKNETSYKEIKKELFEQAKTEMIRKNIELQI